MKLTPQQIQKVEALLAQMTLEEKIGQMNLESPSIVGGFDVSFEELIEMVNDGRVSQEDFVKIMSTATRDFHEDDIRAGRVGGMMGDNPHDANRLQKIAVEQSRLGIPLIMGFDVIHGFRTVYPIAIAEACSFDPDLFRRTAQLAARESRNHGTNWTFAPMVDVARDARWGRVSEGPGEDPYLGSVFARCKIQGLQNTQSGEPYVAACLKHYVAYGACESGRDYNTTSMAHSMLYNGYLPPFKAAVEEGAATVMASFNDLNGVPCTLNKFTLRDILKGTYQFNGFVVSDANAIRECVVHGYSEDEATAGADAVNGGMDMDMGTEIYLKTLKESVEQGKVSMALIDDAVRRILSVKVWLGLFENPYVSEQTIAANAVLPESSLALAREAAEKSMVLLKNEGNILPLNKKQKISLVGTLADKREEVIGAWAMSWQKEDCVSILDGLKNAGAEVNYYPCGGPEGELNQQEITAACENGDVIVAVVGELVTMSGEASSKADISIPNNQKELLEKLLQSGKPVVTLLMNGRPMAIQWEAEHLPVLMECWHLGVQMGNAVANVLFGDATPQGKLSSTFPKVTGQCPVYYNHPNTGRPGSKSKYTSRYLDAGFEVLYPFGYGLSYTTFSYDALNVTEDSEKLTVTVNVCNTGSRTGVETVQLYTQDVFASIVRPVKELKGFTKVSLHAGESAVVTLTVNKSDLGFYNDNGEYRLEDGKFRVYVGGNSRDCLMQEINLTFQPSITTPRGFDFVTRKLKNPIISGFYPDPTICRVGEDYYLACSSFELSPALPVFHSKDLANWEQIGYAMTPENGFHVEKNTFNGGVMAPTLRYHNGIFYIINANFSDAGNFITTATNPAGPWSEPHWLTDVPGIDASLFFDDDGQCYVMGTAQCWPNETGGIRQGVWVAKYDIENFKVIGESVPIYGGAFAGAASPEAPHIYHIGNYYYLLIAEGGTEHYHSVTIARSNNVFGPYENNPANPLITHRHMGFRCPIGNVGHADLVQLPDGTWYAVMLASRLIDGVSKNLGRETFICPVEWQRGWPLFTPETGKMEWEYDAPTSLCEYRFAEKSPKDDFDSETLSLDWSFWGVPYEKFWSIAHSKLTIRCIRQALAEPLRAMGFVPAYSKEHYAPILFQRQRQIKETIRCQMTFVPTGQETAGLATIQAMNHQLHLQIALVDGVRKLQLVQYTSDFTVQPYMPNFTSATNRTLLAETEWAEDSVILELRLDGNRYTASYGCEQNNLTVLAQADGFALNPEKVGCMTGTMIGVFATGNGSTVDNCASFDWFLHTQDE